MTERAIKLLPSLPIALGMMVVMKDRSIFPGTVTPRGIKGFVPLMVVCSLQPFVLAAPGNAEFYLVDAVKQDDVMAVFSYDPTDFLRCLADLSQFITLTGKVEIDFDAPLQCLSKKAWDHMSKSNGIAIPPYLPISPYGWYQNQPKEAQA
jgi:hypothetical protein